MLCVCYGPKIELKNRAAKHIVMFYNYFTFLFYRLNPKKTIQQQYCRMVFCIKLHVYY